MEVKDAIPKLISDMNLRERRNITNCNELGVDIRVGDICYIDFGEAYIYEIGFQHFGIIMTLFHNKAFVVPMSGNHSAYVQAYGKDNPKGKRHLMRLGKIRGMNKESVLFINDAKWINTAPVSYTHLTQVKENCEEGGSSQNEEEKQGIKELQQCMVLSKNEHIIDVKEYQRALAQPIFQEYEDFYQ